MQKLKVLTALIEKEDKRGAISLLKDIHRENACSGYAFALEKILLIETAKELNDKVRGFYINSEELKTALFSENPPASVGCIYIGPLKALINDQFTRLPIYVTKRIFRCGTGMEMWRKVTNPG